MASRNPFALLAGDGDDSDVEQKTLPKQSKPVAVDVAPKDGKPATRGGAVPSATTRRNVPGQTTVRPQKEANELPASDAPAGEKAQFEGERGRDDRGNNFGRGRGRGAPRGEGRGRGGRGGGAPRGGRQDRPDRRSQTGRVDSEKAEHQGWGGDEGKRELEAETAGVTDAAAEKNGDGTATPAVVNGDETEAAAASTDAPAAEAKVAEAPVEEEDNSKTYEEFLKEQKAAGRGVLDTLAVQGRKANEGSDDAQWKDGVRITKGENDETFLGDLQKEKAQAKAKKERKEKNVLEVEFQAPARPGAGDRREGGARGGRGGARGSGRGRGEAAPRGSRGAPRGAGAGRGGRGGSSSQSNNINLSDNTAFPSLS